MFTWAGSNTVFGVGRKTGSIIVFVVTFTRTGEPVYTPVARAQPVFAAPASA